MPEHGAGGVSGSGGGVSGAVPVPSVPVSGVGGSSYSADPARVQYGLREMQKIAGLAQEMMRDFEAAVAVTRGWEGEGDSFARENKPRVAAENKAASETVRAVAEAISSAADATAGNVKSIQSHQGGVVDAVREEARKSEGLGRR